MRYDELAANADWSRELDSRTRSIVESSERCDKLRRTVESLDVLLSPVVEPAGAPKIANANSISVKETRNLSRWRERIALDLDKEKASLTPLVDTLPPELSSVSKSAARRNPVLFLTVHDATKQQLIWKEQLLQIETQQSTCMRLRPFLRWIPPKILAEQVDEASWAKLQTGDASVLTALAPEFSQDVTVAKHRWGNSQETYGRSNRHPPTN